MSKLENVEATGSVILKIMEFVIAEHPEILEEFFEKNPELMEAFNAVFESHERADDTLNPAMYG